MKLNLSHLWPIGTSSCWLLVTNRLGYFLVIGYAELLQVHLVHFLPPVGISHSSKNLQVLLVGNAISRQQSGYWGYLLLLISYLSRDLKRQSRKNLSISLYKNMIFIYLYPGQYLIPREFILSLIQIQDFCLTSSSLHVHPLLKLDRKRKEEKWEG